MEDQVRLAVVEQKVEDLKPIIIKLDATIEKLSDVNTSVSRLLAVHEERISKQEEADDILFAKIDKLRDKMDRNYDGLLQRLRQLEKRVWLTIGGIAVMSFIVNNSGIFSKFLTTQQSSLIIERSYSG
jgi:ABC-type antimicrobial peptide transport system permease subunit